MTWVPTPPWRQRLHQSASRVGISPDYFRATMMAESNGRNVPTGIRNASGERASSATGPFQFVDSTWQGLMRNYPQAGLTPDGRTNPDQQAIAAPLLAAEELPRIRNAGVENPVFADLYSTHVYGGDRGSRLAAAYRRNPGQRAADIIPREQFQQHGISNPDATVGDVYQHTARSFGRHGNPFTPVEGGAPRYAGPDSVQDAQGSLGTLPAERQEGLLPLPMDRQGMGLLSDGGQGQGQGQGTGLLGDTGQGRDDMFGGLLGTGEANMPLTLAGLAMMNNAGPSLEPRGMFEGVPQAMMQGQAMQQSQNEQRQRQEATQQQQQGAQSIAESYAQRGRPDVARAIMANPEMADQFAGGLLATNEPSYREFDGTLFQETPEGLVAVMQGGQEVDTQMANTLRGEYNSAVAPFVEIQTQFEGINRSLGTGTAAGDLAGIFQFMKMLDPGSVVREGEFATAQNASGIEGRIRNMYNQVLEGTRLTPQQRQEFIGVAGDQMQVYTDRLGRVTDTYRNLSEQAGVPADLVVSPVDLRTPLGNPPGQPEQHRPGVGLLSDDQPMSPGDVEVETLLPLPEGPQPTPREITPQQADEQMGRGQPIETDTPQRPTTRSAGQGRGLLDTGDDEPQQPAIGVERLRTMPFSELEALDVPGRGDDRRGVRDLRTPLSGAAMMPTREERLGEIRRERARRNRTRDQPSGGRRALTAINTGSRAAEDMALLGLGDEIYSGAMAVPAGLLEYATSDDESLGLLSAIGGQYGDRVRRMDDIRRAEYERAPVAAGVGSVAGALAGGPRMIGEAVAPAVARMPMGGVGRAVGWGGVGAGEGAVVGAATSAPGDRTSGSIEGGVIGTGFGALGSVAGDLGGAALRRVVGRGAGQSRVSAEMEGAMNEAGVTPQQAQQRLQDLGPEGVLADVDPRLRSLGENVANRSAAVRARAEEILGPRQQGQSERLTRTVRDATGAEGSAFAAADEIARRKADIARAPLQQARQQGFEVTEDIQSLLQRPAIQRAHEAAQRKAANEGVDLPPIYSVDDEGNRIINPDLDPQQLFGAFDYIRRQLNQQGAMANNQLALAQASASGRSADVEDAIAASRLAGEWRDALRNQNQPYGEFLGLYAGEFANERAMSAGQLLWRRRSDGREVDRIVSDLDDMSQTELAYFREGFTQSLIDQLENSALTGQAARSLLRTPRMQSILRRVITGAVDDADQGEAAYEAFSRALDAEIDMGETFRRTLTGSPTAQRLAGAERMDEDPRSLIGNLATGNMGGAMGQVAQAMGRRAGNLSPGQEAELGRMLFTPGMDANRMILEGIMRRQGVNQIGQTGIPSGVMGAGVAEGARQN